LVEDGAVALVQHRHGGERNGFEGVGAGAFVVDLVPAEAGVDVGARLGDAADVGVLVVFFAAVGELDGHGSVSELEALDVAARAVVDADHEVLGVDADLVGHVSSVRCATNRPTSVPPDPSR
jgi:hypothetical protein